MDQKRQREPRKTYTREFKINAVRLTESGDQTIAQIAQDLGVDPNVLYKWRQKFREDPREAFPGKGRQKSEADELHRLRRENAFLRAERDFLKKAAVWLAREAH